jgi:hypothetical protein
MTALSYVREHSSLDKHADEYGRIKIEGEIKYLR